MPKMLIVSTPREGFVHQLQSLHSIFENTGVDYDLLCIECSRDRDIISGTNQLQALYSFTIKIYDRFVYPNFAREIGRKYALTHGYEYVVFIDNDVIVQPGWLYSLYQCAIAHDASAISPIICQGSNPFKEVHVAGGLCRIDGGALIEQIDYQGLILKDLDINTGPTELFEFHCVLLKVEDIPPFDLELVNTREHIDLSLTLQKCQKKIYLCTDSVVSYLPPRLETLSEIVLYSLRWSSKYKRKSLQHFSTKWKIGIDSLLSMRPIHSPRRKFLIQRFYGILGIYVEDAHTLSSIMMLVEPKINDFLSLLATKFYEPPNENINEYR